MRHHSIPSSTADIPLSVGQIHPERAVISIGNRHGDGPNQSYSSISSKPSLPCRWKLQTKSDSGYISTSTQPQGYDMSCADLRSDLLQPDRAHDDGFPCCACAAKRNLVTLCMMQHGRLNPAFRILIWLSAENERSQLLSRESISRTRSSNINKY